jgi:copper chaperone CopZ
MFGNKNKINIVIHGMSSRHCAGAVKAAIENIHGVIKARVDLSRDCVEITMNENINPEVFYKAIENAGYKTGGNL